VPADVTVAAISTVHSTSSVASLIVHFILRPSQWTKFKPYLIAVSREVTVKVVKYYVSEIFLHSVPPCRSDVIEV